MPLQELLKAYIEEDPFEGAIAAVGAWLGDECRGGCDVEVTIGHASFPYAGILDDHRLSHSLHRILTV